LLLEDVNKNGEFLTPDFPIPADVSVGNLEGGQDHEIQYQLFTRMSTYIRALPITPGDSPWDRVVRGVRWLL